MNDKKDCIFVETEFMKGIISELVHKALEKKGFDADIQLNNFVIENREENLHVHLNIEASAGTGELEKLLKNIM